MARRWWLIGVMAEGHVKRIFEGRLTTDGAGVRLRRVFSNNTVALFDPFLLLDNFGSDDSDDYVRGFPWHPHRGIETVTYMLEGEVEHGDSMGNSGVIRSGDIQWMTAGCGIIHQEMPKKYDGTMRGFQLWVNLPAKSKMISPKYRGITGDQVPTLKEGRAEIKVVAGKVGGVKGPVSDLAVDVEYFDVKLAAGGSFERPAESTTFAHVIEGSGSTAGMRVKANQCALFDEGGEVRIVTDEGIRFLFVSGKPLKEPVAWGGPIVMNTQEELEEAFRELSEGTFIKEAKGGVAKA